MPKISTHANGGPHKEIFNKPLVLIGIPKNPLE